MPDKYITHDPPSACFTAIYTVLHSLSERFVCGLVCYKAAAALLCWGAGQVVPQDLVVSPEPVTHLSQHRLLPLLLKHAQQLSAAYGSCADIQFGMTVTAVSNVEFPHHRHQQHIQYTQSAAMQPGSGASLGQQQQQQNASNVMAAEEYSVCIAVQPSSTAASGTVNTQELIRCRYLAAADGAHSSIRCDESSHAPYVACWQYRQQHSNQLHHTFSR